MRMDHPEDANHNYAADEFFERVTPLSDIPEKFRVIANLPGGGTQVVDKRLAYNWNSAVGALVECGSVAGDAMYED